MVYVYIRHTVEDYDSWKPGFDAHADTRREFGSTENFYLFHAAEDSNDVSVLGEWDSAENFQRFMAESDVAEKMAELGVVGEPEIEIFEVIEAPAPQPSAA